MINTLKVTAAAQVKAIPTMRGMLTFLAAAGWGPRAAGAVALSIVSISSSDSPGSGVLSRGTPFSRSAKSSTNWV